MGTIYEHAFIDLIVNRGDSPKQRHKNTGVANIFKKKDDKHFNDKTKKRFKFGKLLVKHFADEF